MKYVKFITALFAAILIGMAMVGSAFGTSAYGETDIEFGAASVLDFSSKRLLVMTEDESIFDETSAVISSFEGVHLLQFDDEKEAENAYEYYLEKGAMVEPDMQVAVCEDSYSEDSSGDFSDEVNPLNELALELEKISDDESSFEDYDIALIDTGANFDNVAAAVSVIGEEADDDNGHGSRMAEFIFEKNPDAKVLSVKAFGEDGRGDISAVYAAVEYAISQNVKIINLSFSAYSSVTNSVLAETVRKAVGMGITVVGSAGNNSGYAKYFVPANIDEAIICGSCDEEGKRLELSNFGDSVDYYVASSSTSEAAAKMSGFLCSGADVGTVINDGFIFEINDIESDIEGISKEASPDGKLYTRDIGKGNLFTVADYGTFWSDPDFGEGDVLYFGNFGGVTYPAYCIDHGLYPPSGGYDSYGDVSNQLGYVMRNGYPNNTWGLPWHEAQYLTQCAVFGVIGVDLYNISDGQMPAAWIYDQIWGAGHFYIAESLISQAWNYGSSADVPFAAFWYPNNGYSQRVVTPSRTGSFNISKTVNVGAGSLVISKTTSGAASDADAEFTFSLSVKNGAGQVQSTKFSYTGAKTGTISGNGGTVKLKNGQSITVTGIPAGYSYTVTEAEEADYSVTPSSRTISGKIPSVSPDQSFDFTVYFSTGGSFPYGGSKEGNISHGGTISLSSGQYVNIGYIPAGATYQVVETPVNGYAANTTSISGTISAGATGSAQFINTYTPPVQRADFSNERKGATLVVSKTTTAAGSCREELSGNAMYSQDFSGAEFSVRVFDKNTKQWSAAKTYTTGTDGKFTVSGLFAGDTIEVTEVKAPKGYLVSKAATQTLAISAGGNEMTFKDDPAFDVAEPLVRKARYENGRILERFPVKGAVYKLEYFDNAERSGDAKRTWYFITDDNGQFSYKPECLAEGYSSDAFYIDVNGQYNMPLGSVKMTEEKAPAGFLKNKGFFEGVILQDSISGKAHFKWLTADENEEVVNSGKLLMAGGNPFGENKTGEELLVGEEELVIAVDKIDSGTGKSLKDAVLQLLKDGSVLKEWTTDGKVMEIRNILIAGETYTIHEKSAPDGYKEAPDIEFTSDEDGNITVITAGIDSFTTEGGYLGVKMEDEKMIALPLTGLSDGLSMIFAGLAIILGSLFAFYFIRLSSRKGKICKNSFGKIIAIMAACLSMVIFAQPVQAAGNIEVVSKGDNVISYQAYMILEGNFEDDTLWNIRLPKNISESTWKRIGASSETVKAKNGELMASWLSEKIEKDTDGSFVKKLAQEIVNDKDVAPVWTFKSGDRVRVNDGYYLIVSDETYPMMIMAGGGTTQKIYEKRIPKNPETGDSNHVNIYYICLAAGLVVTGICILIFMKSKMSFEKGKNGRTKK